MIATPQSIGGTQFILSLIRLDAKHTSRHQTHSQPARTVSMVGGYLLKGH